MTLLAVAPSKLSPGLRDDGFAYRRDPRTHIETRLPAVPFDHAVAHYSNILDDVYPTDAHFVTYVLRRGGHPVRRQPRINKAAVPWLERLEYRVSVGVFAADVDTPEHRPWTSSAAAVDAATRLAARIGTAAVYVTKKGLRLVQPLERSVDVAGAESSQRAWLGQVAPHVADLGLVLDWSCDDWTRYYRCPHVRRDGAAYRSPLVLTERARCIEPPASASVRQRQGAVTPRSHGQIVFSAAIGADSAPLVAPIARALARFAQDVGTRHDMALALAGALTWSRRVPPPEVPALVVEVTRAAGWPRDRAAEFHKGAVDTVLKWRQGHRVQGARGLPPEVADAIRQALDLSRLQLAAPPPAAPARPLADTTRELEDAIRRAPEGVTIIKAQCGLGKTRAARLVAAERAMRGGPRTPNTKTGIAVPTNELAVQIAEDLRAAGVAVLRVFGPLSVRGEYDGWECRYRAPAAALAEGGQSVGRLFCKACDYKTECRAAQGFDGPTDARVIVGPHALLADIDELCGATGLLIVDEPPSVIEDELFALDDLILAEKMLALHFERRYAASMAPAARAIRDWLNHELDARIGRPQDASRAFDLGVDPGLLERAFEATGLADAAELVRAMPELPPVVRGSAVAAMRVGGLAARIGLASRALRAIHRSICRPGMRATLYERDNGTRELAITGIWQPLEAALLARSASGAAKVGRRTIVAAADADLYVDAYERLLGSRPPLREFRAPDGAPIERAVLVQRGANRRSWSSGDLTGLDGALQAVATWARERAAKSKVSPFRAGVVTFKAIENHVAKKLRDLAPAIEWRTGHYQAMRGLDGWKVFNATVTFGDPWINIEATSRELGGEASDDDVYRRGQERCRAELEQAHGRLRTVHRSEPGWQLHVGAEIPAGWQTQDPAAPFYATVQTSAVGRPRRAIETTSEELRELIATVGGYSAAGRIVRKSHQAIRQWVSGRCVPDAADTALLRLAARLSVPVVTVVPSCNITPVSDLTGDMLQLPSSPLGPVACAEDSHASERRSAAPPTLARSEAANSDLDEAEAAYRREVAAMLAHALRIDARRVRLDYVVAVRDREIVLRDFDARIDGQRVSELEAEALAVWCAEAARTRGGAMMEA